MIALVLVAGLVGSVFALGVLRGWVITYLWLWFVVPLGLPAIGFWHAFGLSVLVSLLTATAKSEPHPKPEGVDALKRFGDTLLTGFLAPIFGLLFGYIASGLMAA